MSEEKKISELRRTASSGSVTYSQAFSIRVLVQSGKDLIPLDRFGKSDPYVVVMLGGRSMKTNAVFKSLNPKWKKHFHFHFAKKPDPKLRLECFDKDLFKKDEPMGFIEVDLTDMFEEAEAFKVNNPGHVNAAKLGVSREYEMSLQGVASGIMKFRVDCGFYEEVSGRMVTDTLVDYSKLQYLLDLHVVEAKGLAKTDVIGKADPYAEVSFGLENFRTKVKEGTDSPVWNSHCPLWVMEGYSDRLLRLSVFDQDSVETRDWMGSLYLRPADFAPGEQMDVWLPLTKDKTDSDAQLARLAQKMAAQMKEKDGEAESKIDGSGGQVHIRLRLRTVEEMRESVLMAILKEYDTDESGTLEELELAHMLETIDCPLTDEELHDAFVAVDKDGTGKLTIQQAMSLLNSKKLFSDDSSMKQLYVYTQYGTDSVMMLRAVHEGKETHVDNSGSEIWVQDRVSGLLVRESIPIYIKSAMRLLYRTHFGRLGTSFGKTHAILKRLTVHEGHKMDKPKSRRNIAKFIETHSINVDEIAQPLGSYKTFNEFFYRQLRPGVRPIASPDNDGIAVCPADCRLSVFKSEAEAKDLWIKGHKFSVHTLIGDWGKDDGKRDLFINSPLVIARLAPQDYHRWHFPVSGKSLPRLPIDGGYTTVNPIAVRKNVNVYTENKRVVCPIETEKFGLVLLVAIGATMVGSINFVTDEDATVKKGDEHGYFAFGGSTCILVFQPGTILFDDDLVANSRKKIETLVKVGMRLGVSVE